MSDLRDRIAAVIASGRMYRSNYELSDAVIRELGTDCIYRYVCAHCGEFWFNQSERMQRFALLHNKGHLND